ncbi:GPW/gp25 family protein [Budviciaceae bacterium CWB-B4]|uniref:GPW/gp25 family protein n=1 Tax=Limnobaculum xujianqingii TaxID=2738837 RepID=A0A9D7AI85_9GAMM|nr:GPW/gp25 family protein [Limnobaculum xujianqingii]MBK5073219.1 GPW/gp25 family protein [Limnobaculum xujianqingii]MBK5176528.1 GPW/gp25 family protein [Limnobaculum xujianqingii]
MNNVFSISDDGSEFSIGATGLVEIAQNIRVIISTVRGSVFLDRSFGIDGNVTDKSHPKAIVAFRNDVMDQIERYEPRVDVLSVDFEQSTEDAMDGKLLPVIKIKIKEGVLL